MEKNVMNEQFETHLRKGSLSENTIVSYLWTIDYYLSHYDGTTAENLLTYKGYLLEKYKPKTVNLRIQAVNKYLEFLGKDKLQLKFVKIQQKTFLENVISNADYTFLKNSLKKDDNLEWYFVVWYLAATGARVSELVQIKVEHVQAGYFDLYAKGGKLRRLYIPKTLQLETLDWLEKTKKTSGYLFLNRFGERITTRGISQQLKNYAEKYELDTKVVYPHSFRHRFAKNFLEKYKDIALLADLMGHESIETTRIYLRRTASEQHALVDKIVTW
jgi:site-specific recombinase XerD